MQYTFWWIEFPNINVGTLLGVMKCHKQWFTLVVVASRLGRRPKRLKAHYGSETKVQVPAKPITIAPQPGPLFTSKLPLSMAELEVKRDWILSCIICWYSIITEWALTWRVQMSIVMYMKNDVSSNNDKGLGALYRRVLGNEVNRQISRRLYKSWREEARGNVPWWSVPEARSGNQEEPVSES